MLKKGSLVTYAVILVVVFAVVILFRVLTK